MSANTSDRDATDRRVLTVRVETTADFFDRGAAAIAAAERGESADAGPSVSLGSHEELQRLLRPTNVTLLEAIREHAPESIRSLARIVDRDVHRVHDDVSELAELGFIEFEDGPRNAKAPRVRFDELDVRIPLLPDDTAEDAGPAGL